MRRPAIGMVLGAAAIVFAAGASACGGAAPAENKVGADEVTAMWAKAVTSGDASALAALYVDDARSTPPGGPPTVGKSQIEAYWRDDLKPGGDVTKLTATESIAQGNLLHVSGSYDVASKEGVTVAKGQYEQLWKRDNAGWKVQSEMWRIDPSSQRDPALADRLESQWTTAYNAGNATALAELYNKDAVLSTRPTGSIEGKEAIEYFWKGDFGDGKPSTKLALTDVYLAGDLAHLEGEYEVADKGKVTKGHYVQLWMQDGDAWRIHREVWWQ
jgi:ketosteroid isomerase-like protein